MQGVFLSEPRYKSSVADQKVARTTEKNLKMSMAGWGGNGVCNNTREVGDDSSPGQFMTLDSTWGSEVDASAPFEP